MSFPKGSCLKKVIATRCRDYQLVKPGLQATDYVHRVLQAAGGGVLDIGMVNTSDPHDWQ